MKKHAKPSMEHYEESFRKGGGNGLKTLLQLYRGSYRELAGSAAAFAVKHSPCWILPLVIANIINFATGVSEVSQREFVWSIIGFSALLLLNVPFQYLHVRLYSQVMRRTEAGLRFALVAKLQQLSIPYHKKTESGRLQSKLMRDVEQFEMVSEQLFINMVMFSLTLAFTISVTLAKSPLVFAFFVCAVPVAAAVMLFFRKRVKRKNRDFRSEMENTSAQLMEMVELVPVTRAHALEDWEIGRVSKQIHRVRLSGFRLDTFQALFGSVAWLTFQLFQVLCLAFTGYLAYRKMIPVGDVALYQSYFGTIVGSVTAVIQLIPIISKGLESVSSIGDVLLSDEVEHNEGKERVDEVRGAYRFDHVSYHYPDDDKLILQDFSLNVQPGETIALVGESGAGKTTVLNLVIGFLLPTGGCLQIDGYDITQLHLQSYRCHISVVPQEPVLFTGTIRENITYGLPDVSEDKLWEVIDAAHLREMVESLPEGLETKMSEHGANLSGGQRQRISIARALIRDPEVIVLDEATSALDSVSEKKIQQALQRLTKGRTTFIVAHRLSTIRDADRIAVMENGACVEIGNYEELMQKQGAFYRYQQLQR